MMDNISHDCVGYLLMRTAHHDGRFLPTTYFAPYGINLVIEEIAFQYPMKCKDKNLIWEDGILHWRSAIFGHDDRHSPWVGWVKLMSRRLGKHLQIYDTRQQDAILCLLLLKEFGHHMTHSILKSRMVDGTWHGTYIIW